MKTWQNTDKTGWEDGPWMTEPDKAVWVDSATGLDCMIHRNPVGALCGYVGVGPDHPWHGVHYNDIDVDVHGGLTFSAACTEEATEDDGICHVPEPGRPHDVWWLGFDCAHAMDRMPGMEFDERKMGEEARATGNERIARLFLEGPPSRLRGTYKDFRFVKEWVEDLAQQAREAADG